MFQRNRIARRKTERACRAEAAWRRRRGRTFQVRQNRKPSISDTQRQHGEQRRDSNAVTITSCEMTL